MDKYAQIKAPNVRNYKTIDNPLLPRSGVPITDDDFVDSSERIINATNNNDVRYDKINNIWNVDPSEISDNTKKIDLGKFNKVFERTKEEAKREQKLIDLEKLNKLSEETQRVSLYDLTISQIIINTKNAWFYLLDDLLDQKFSLDTFTKDNRLFYIGITILFFSIISYLYNMIVNEND